MGLFEFIDIVKYIGNMFNQAQRQNNSLTGCLNKLVEHELSYKILRNDADILVLEKQLYYCS